MTKTEKYILIFQEESRAIQYGIGTYTLTLQNLRCRYCAYGYIYVDYNARKDEKLSSYKAKQVLNY